MQPAGLAVFHARDPKRAGVYSFEQEGVRELDDAEIRRFRKNTVAWSYFEATPPGYRKTLLHWITTAKKPQTRAQRLDQFIQACAEQRRMR
jgi:uncharacterized protein YdeI (YjbR/CyaY-like superfamily)